MIEVAAVTQRCHCSILIGPSESCDSKNYSSNSLMTIGVRRILVALRSHLKDVKTGECVVFSSCFPTKSHCMLLFPLAALGRLRTFYFQTASLLCICMWRNWSCYHPLRFLCAYINALQTDTRTNTCTTNRDICTQHAYMHKYTGVLKHTHIRIQFCKHVFVYTYICIHEYI